MSKHHHCCDDHDDDHHHHRDDDNCFRRLRKLAKKTHLAGFNCCSSFKNIFSRRCHH